MATNRKINFANDYIYHVFNRGIDRRVIFKRNTDFKRGINLLSFYRFKNPPMRYSKFLNQPADIQQEIIKKMSEGEVLVEIIAFCLMPNHFHFLLKQKSDNGITNFVSNFSNAYTRYFNKRNDRKGDLLEGTFKAVFVENDEQLLHVLRYIHLNPVVASIIPIEKLAHYLWSSHPEYLNKAAQSLSFIKFSEILDFFRDIQTFEKFINDQADYAKKLKIIKDLILE